MPNKIPENSDRVLRSCRAYSPANSDISRNHTTDEPELTDDDIGDEKATDDHDTRKIDQSFVRPPNAPGIPTLEELYHQFGGIIRQPVVRGCVLAAVVAVLAYFLWPWAKKEPNFEGFDLFKMLIFKERRSFNQNEGTFEILAEGVAPPSCITLLYLDGKDEAECISSRIKNLHETTFSTVPIVLRGSEIYESEPFEFLESYGRKLNESKLMLLYDLEKIDAGVAENFHSLCDVENPFVRDSLIIFTLNMDAKHQSLKNPLKRAHRTLSERWKELETSALDPLITRVTNVVVEINKENDFTCPK